jgi:fructose-bisphosphate aldolase, class I
MNTEKLIETVRALTASGKGILAIDESLKTCTERFEKLGVPCTPETRQEYRELLITTPDINRHLSGYIMVQETADQTFSDGATFASYLLAHGMIPGIKVDLGTAPMLMSDEMVTNGLDELSKNLDAAIASGATFLKWRAVFHIDSDSPSDEVILENAKRFAAYARAAQARDIVPIVEPELLTTGNHSHETARAVSEKILNVVFQELIAADVYLPGMILKTYFVTPGADGETVSADQVGHVTAQNLLACVPPTVGAIVFLSGGFSTQQSCEYLAHTVHAGHLIEIPWPMTFSFGRAIQGDALAAWAHGRRDAWDNAQVALLRSAKAASQALTGDVPLVD